MQMRVRLYNLKYTILRLLRQTTAQYTYSVHPNDKKHIYTIQKYKSTQIKIHLLLQRRTNSRKLG